jgi:small-conductance mechanosensitive channel
MPALPRLLLVLSLLLLGGPLLHAQDATQPPAPTASTAAPALAALGKRLDAVKSALSGKTIEVPLADLRSQALDVQQQADAIGDVLEPEQAALKAKLTVLGPVPAKGAPPETAEVAAKRRQLERDARSVDALVAQAQQISHDSLRLAAQTASLRREQFQAQLGARTATPFSRAFWAEPLRSLPGDMTRLRRLGQHGREALAAAWQPAGRWPLLLCLAGAALLLLFGRRLFVRRLLLPACQRLPDGHLRRSVMAVGTVLSITLAVGLAASLARAGLDWRDTLGDDLDALTQSLVWAIWFAAFVAALGYAVLSAKRPSWRLPALSDAAAESLRAFPWLLGAAALLLGVLERIGSAIGASLPATVSIRGALALVISGLVGAALLRLDHARRVLQTEGTAPATRPLWVGLLLAALALGVVLAWLGVVTGYIAFAFFVAWQMLWLGVIVATLYLLTHLLNDALVALLDPHQPGGRRLQAAFGVSHPALAQAATVLSALVRVLLLLCGMAALLTPFGAGPQELLARVYHFFGRHALGQLPIKPGAVLSAIAVFVVGLVLIRAVKRWLMEQLLPKTSLDPGVQNSAVTLLGYVAVVLLFALSLAALDVPLQSITWVASALSVGIGFGLQAIVQNFISGLILLAEQPVKVGDWVSLSDVEGDIRRINVRATEIQLGDRSTVIVPNSQLITQNVRNVTRAGAQGRVRFLLPMPLGTDAEAARRHILDALLAHPATLETPTPVVRLEDVSASAMTFSAVAYVRSPRDVAGVKSDLLFDILKRLAAANLPLSTPQSMLVRTLRDDDGKNAAPPPGA